MRIGVAGSMHHTEKLLEAKSALENMGHEAFASGFASAFLGKTDSEREDIKQHQKNHLDAIREFWKQMQGADALLVMNMERHGIPGYVGGNTLMEMGFAHVLNQRIFLFNPIPDIKFYKTEIEAMKPVILNGNYQKVEDADRKEDRADAA